MEGTRGRTMKYKTLFRLMLKWLGVYFFSHGVYYTAPGLISLIYSYSQTGGPLPGRDEWYRFVNLSGPLLYCGFGLYLFFGGKWIVDKAIPSNRPYCHECGYDLTAAAQNRCPECGTPFRPEDVMPRATPDEIANVASPADATDQRTTDPTADN